MLFLCSVLQWQNPFRWGQGTSHLLTLTKERQEMCYQVITLQLHPHGRSVWFEEIDIITKAARSHFMTLYSLFTVNNPKPISSVVSISVAWVAHHLIQSAGIETTAEGCMAFSSWHTNLNRGKEKRYDIFSSFRLDYYFFRRNCSLFVIHQIIYFWMTGTKKKQCHLTRVAASCETLTGFICRIAGRPFGNQKNVHFHATLKVQVITRRFTGQSALQSCLYLASRILRSLVIVIFRVTQGQDKWTVEKESDCFTSLS